MPIVLNGSTGITTEGINVDTIVDTAGTGGPSLPNNIVEMDFVDVLGDITNLETNKLNKDQNIVLGTSVAASGTAVDFVGIPEGVKRITVMFDGVSTNGASNLQMQIGSDTFETSGYSSIVQFSGSPTAFGGGFGVASSVAAASSMHGIASILYISNNKYAETSNISSVNGVVFVSAGSKTLSGPLTKLRITTVNGTDQFDAGTINISWEF